MRLAVACSIDDCDLVSRKRGWCDKHYTRWLNHGDPLKTIGVPNATVRLCLVCGKTDWIGFRSMRYCSGACQRLWQRNEGVVPLVKPCDRCGTVIDLTVLGPSGRKKRADTKLCDACHRSKYTRHHMSVTELAARDGLGCGICGDPVDMNLRHPDLFRASVDHVLPYARGGSHDAANLQLAHLWCNYVKSDRPDFSMTRAEEIA